MPNAKQYAKNKEKMLLNPELYIKEKERINNIVKNKYATDPVFRNRCINYQRQLRGSPLIDLNQDQ
jgi:hypothetical protein